MLAPDAAATAGSVSAAALASLLFAAGCRSAPLPALARSSVAVTATFPGTEAASAAASAVLGSPGSSTAGGPGGSAAWPLPHSPRGPATGGGLGGGASGSEGFGADNSVPLRAFAVARHALDTRYRAQYLSARLQTYLSALCGAKAAVKADAIVPLVRHLVRAADPAEPTEAVLAKLLRGGGAQPVAAWAAVLAAALPPPPQGTAASDATSATAIDALLRTSSERLSGLHRGTFVEAASLSSSSDSDREPAAVPRLVVDSCSDAHVYVSRSPGSLLLSNLSRCTVVLPPATSGILVDACVQCTIVAAGAFVTISNCADCSFYLGTPCRPLLVGDCRGNKVAPYAAVSPRLQDRLSSAPWAPATPLELPAGRWAQPVAPLASSDTPLSAIAEPLPPSEFLLFRTPGTGISSAATGIDDQSISEDDMPPLPAEYASQLVERDNAATRMREEIETSEFSFTQQRELQAAVQTGFLVREPAGCLRCNDRVVFPSCRKAAPAPQCRPISLAAPRPMLPLLCRAGLDGSPRTYP